MVVSHLALILGVEVGPTSNHNRIDNKASHLYPPLTLELHLGREEAALEGHLITNQLPMQTKVPTVKFVLNLRFRTFSMMVRRCISSILISS